MARRQKSRQQSRQFASALPGKALKPAAAVGVITALLSPGKSG
jgi:hypothetical protein